SAEAATRFAHESAARQRSAGNMRRNGMSSASRAWLCVGNGTHVPANHAPYPVFLTRPDARVTVHTSHERASRVDSEPCAKCRHCDVLPHSANAQFLGDVLAKADRTRTMCG